MSDMYTVVTITPEPTDENYPEEWERGTLEDIAEANMGDFASIDPDQIAGNSKYQIDGLTGWAAAYTEANPGSTVEIVEEWTGDGGPSINTYVYRDGVIVLPESKHSELVPDNLADLIAAVRTALDAGVLEVRESGKPLRLPIQDAARALIDALDPQTPKEK